MENTPLDEHQIYLGADEYYIAFDVATNDKYMSAIRVRLDNVTIIDMTKLLHIDLVNHPLYKELEDYVLANRRKTK